MLIKTTGAAAMCQIDWSAIAAWVQAVFSVVAIGVAIWLGERQSRRIEQAAERERKRRAATVAAGLAITIQAIAYEAKKLQGLVEKTLEAVPEGDGSFVLSTSAKLVQVKPFRELPTMDSIITWTSVLDGDAAQQTLLTSETANAAKKLALAVIESLAGVSSRASYAKGRLETLISALDQLVAATEGALAQLRPIHGLED